ncbi:MAG: nucleotide sugar dehydrogenase [Planctomycetota bacterium]|nr:nucleotide sugar dehydrogenase [Planctomycetota bacterium]
MNETASGLLSRIESKSAIIGIVGLGYVGLPLTRAILDAGFKVIGYDIDQSKIDAIRAGKPYIHHLGQEFFDRLKSEGSFEGTTDPAALARADAILLCVPTPLGTHKEPDLSYVLGSTRLVAKTLRKGQLIVLESTTYPGTTRDEMGPILDATGLKRNKDYFLAYSPEREDPGSAGRSAAVIPKLVGGTDEVSGRIAHALYSRIVASAHLVSTAEVAESAKLLENIFRCVNIAMVNELKMVFDRMDIDIWEVIAAASTKPFGFMPFYPGPGLGGHCIPIDPFYLTWKAKEVGLPTRFIELAGEINANMPHWVVDKVQAALNDHGKAMKGADILVLGVAYKKNIDDGRETPAAEIIEFLIERGARVAYHDPHIPRFPRMRNHDIVLQSEPLTHERLAAADAVVIVTDHDAVDYAAVVRHARLVVDTRNAVRAAGVGVPAPHPAGAGPRVVGA